MLIPKFPRVCLAFALTFAAQHSLAQSLESLALEQAERMLQARNREVQAARRGVEAAQANTVSAGARPNPLLTLGMSGLNPAVGIGGGSLRDRVVDSSIRVDQLIERGERRELRLAAARNLESASTEDLADTLRQQRLALRSAYYDLLLAQDRAAVARENADLFGRTLDAAELRLKAGDIAAADVARIRVDALRAQNDARSAEADRSRAQLALGYIIGAEADAGRIRASDSWPDKSAGAAAGITEDMIDRRADVRAARNRFEAAQTGRDLARSLRTRDVSVGVQYDHYPVNPNYASGSGAGTGNSYGVFMSVPLFARYYYEGEIARAESDYGAAQDAVERVRAQARAELMRAASDLQSAAERLRRYDDVLLAEARKAAESAEFAYRNGATGVMDLLDSRRTLRAIQLEAAGARSDFAKALSAWLAGAGELK